MTALELKDISISIADTGRSLVADLNLKVEAGSVTTIMGPSGSGKSSLLAFIAGHLEPPLRGSGTTICGKTEISGLPPERRKIGILFQDDMLFPHLTVGGNLNFGLSATVKGRRERMQRIEAALSRSGLDGFAGRDPAALSGGQRARVALLRTLLSGPKALLLDEPFSKLDATMRGDIRDFVFMQAAEQRIPVLLVTHDEEDARIAGGPVFDISEYARP